MPDLAIVQSDETSDPLSLAHPIRPPWVEASAGRLETKPDPDGRSSVVSAWFRVSPVYTGPFIAAPSFAGLEPVWEGSPASVALWQPDSRGPLIEVPQLIITADLGLAGVDDDTVANWTIQLGAYFTYQADGITEIAAHSFAALRFLGKNLIRRYWQFGDRTEFVRFCNTLAYVAQADFNLDEITAA